MEGVNSWQNLALSSVTQGLGGKKKEGVVLVAREQDGIKPSDVLLIASDFLRWFTLLGCQRDFWVFKFVVFPTSFHIPLPD